jgi:hypothetical protein
MPKTVVGVMDTPENAQRVVQDLMACGIRRDDIGFRGSQEHPVPSSAALNESEGSVESPGVVVAVAAESEAQAERAVDILQRHGAVDVEA